MIGSGEEVSGRRERFKWLKRETDWEMATLRQRDLPGLPKWLAWVVLISLTALLGLVYSTLLTRTNVQLHEVETLPSGFEGEIDRFDPTASDSYARFVHEFIPGDGSQAVFVGPIVDLGPGKYRASLAVRALQVEPSGEPLRVEVGYRTGNDILASQSTDVRQLSLDGYEEIAIDFVLDSYTAGIEFRAFYPGHGAFWFDYLKVRGETDSPWQKAYISWPLLVGLFGIALLVNRQVVKDGLSADTALRRPAVERRLTGAGYLALLGMGLFFFGCKYAWDVERIVHAYVIDDAFYYFETAANLARRGQMSFDGVTFTTGFHPLWTLVLVPIYWLGLGNQASFLAGILVSDLISMASILGLFWVLRRHFNVFVAFALTLLFFSQILFPVQYGLETPLLVGTFVALLAFYDSRFQRPLSDVPVRECGLLGGLLGLVVLARIDHALFATTFFVLFLASNRRSLATARGREKVALVVGVAAVLLVPYLLFNYATTGEIVPISGVIKRLWSHKRLLETMNQGSFLEAKVDGFFLLLAEHQHFFWSLLGSLAIAWLLLVRGRLAPVRTLLPFIVGPMVVFAYYLVGFHYPFNSSLWYYPTIWLASLLTFGLMVDLVLKQLRVPSEGFSQGILVGGLIAVLAFQAYAQFARYQGFRRWVDTQTFRDSHKFVSWRAAEYIQGRTWSPGADDQVVFAAADAGVLAFVLDEPVVNLDGLINNEILEYERRDLHWHVYVVEKAAIDYVVNVFRHDWLPRPLFEEHFVPCYISTRLNRDNLGFRIYGRRTALRGDERDSFSAGCVEGQLSLWRASEMPGECDLAQGQDTGNGGGCAATERCATRSASDAPVALVSGHYVSLPAGAYEADYFLSAGDSGLAGEVAYLDVRSAEAGIMAQRSVMAEDFQTVAEFQRFTLPFDVPWDVDKVEFRVFHTGGVHLCVEGIRLLGE